MTQGPLIVRIFIYGLILLEPQKAAGPGDLQSLVANLLEAGNHEARLFYCDAYKGEKCKTSGSQDPLLKKGEEVAFQFEGELGEQTATEPGRVASEEPPSFNPAVGRPFHCIPGTPPKEKKIVLCNSSANPPGSFPGSASEGTDFDWVVGVGQAKGHNGSSKSSSNRKDPFARAVFEEGTVDVCRFVEVPKKCLFPDDMSGGMIVPKVQFFGSDFPPRAVAQTVVVEMARTDATGFSVIRAIAGDLPLPSHPCTDPSGGPARCIELAITNLPAKGDELHCGPDVNDNLWQLAGKHWTAYYDFLGQGGMKPFPIPVVTDDMKSPAQVAPQCPAFPPGAAGVDTWPEQLVQNVHIRYPEDRQICPIGGG